jgi:phosphoheptose isomerase
MATDRLRHRQGVVTFVAAAAVSLGVALPSLLAAQSIVRVGSEFQVNTYTPLLQRTPDLGSDSLGGFVVVWTSAGQDGYTNGVFGRRFDSAGVAKGVEFQVSVATIGQQVEPAVALDASGDFVVAWTSYAFSGKDVFARRFDAAGVPQGVVFQVNSSTADAQYQPAVALDQDGDFVIAWASLQQDASQSGIFARRFNASGTAGPEFQVNSYTPNSQSLPAIALDADGDFVIVWASDYQDGPGFQSRGVFGRRFNALGVPLGAEFQINSYTPGSQGDPDVDLDADGDFVVVWNSALQDGGSYGVFAQRFDSLGARRGTEIPINSFLAGDQVQPAVALHDRGDFAVTWSSAAQDGDGFGVFASEVAASGVPTGDFQLSLHTAGNQQAPRIAADAQGHFVVAWQSEQDGDAAGIFAQRFAEVAPFDVDGDGATQPLTDGLLTLRYEFGFRGATLITGAVGGGCTRCTAPEIEAYLQSMI